MRLSWNEIRHRAACFATEWAESSYEKGETQSFYNEFFEVFGVKRRRVASFEEPVKRLGNRRGFIDLFWKGVLLVEQKSAGRDLRKAKIQALDYFPGLSEAELPRFLLISDFQNFELYDLDEGTEERFALEELPNKVQLFGFILGVQRREFRDQDPVNIQAAEQMARLHDALKAVGYTGHALERLLVRLVFCLFADDTGIFERDSFVDLVTQRSQIDGSDLGRLLGELFEVLNAPFELRQTTLDEDFAAFPFVNGELFSERLPTPAFNSKMRELLVETCNFSWDAISPAIFGSLFQSVMTAAERRTSGAHYTTERNILKVIQPLFMDELWNEFERLRASRGGGRLAALRSFQERLGTLRFFDPACGCGNFLIIAYRELRILELEVLKERFPNRQQVIDVGKLSKLDVGQFYGIEINEFPARIAETALWMIDHIMNNRLGLEFGEAYARIPLKTAPHIVTADALEVDWASILAPQKCSYVFGNPPFVGAKQQTPLQRAQVRGVARLGGDGGTLDYVCAWFLKAGEYLRKSPARIGFVATNSITQGEQVAQLWPLLFDRYGLEISFAHRTFVWGSEARGKANVHVVIIGLTKRSDEPRSKRLYSYDDGIGDPVETSHTALSPYLFDAGSLANRHLVVYEVPKPLGPQPVLKTGVQMIDNGILTFSTEEKTEFLEQERGAERYFRKFIGGDEYINGFFRWILYLRGVDPAELRTLPSTMALLERVRAYRRSSSRESTVRMADFPTHLGVDERLSDPFLVIPNTSSERREYIPIGWLPPDVVANQKLRILPKADLCDFGVLTSRMHMAWVRAITGRMKSDYMYSVGICYNPFPWPSLDGVSRERIRSLAQAVLEARAAFESATLADLYDPEAMPPPLRRAHAALDAAVDRLYRPAPFTSDRERVEHLFSRYEKLVAPLAVGKVRSRSKAPKR